MSRRRSPTPPDLSIPPGWTAHDGQGCPVNGEARPAIMFRKGLRIQLDARPAEYWQNYGDTDCWNWGELPDPYDIVAYLLPAE